MHDSVFFFTVMHLNTSNSGSMESMHEPFSGELLTLYIICKLNLNASKKAANPATQIQEERGTLY
jgi:hypothetical protein